MYRVKVIAATLALMGNRAIGVRPAARLQKAIEPLDRLTIGFDKLQPQRQMAVIVANAILEPTARFEVTKSLFVRQRYRNFDDSFQIRRRILARGMNQQCVPQRTQDPYGIVGDVLRGSREGQILRKPQQHPAIEFDAKELSSVGIPGTPLIVVLTPRRSSHERA